MQRRFILLTILVSSTLAAACVVSEPEAPTRGVVVSGPPPAPMREERPPPPSPSASYVTGYWHWTGMQYAWIPGHWEVPPSGAVWTAPRVTTLNDGRYVYESGKWSNGGRQPPAPPPASGPAGPGVTSPPRNANALR